MRSTLVLVAALAAACSITSANVVRMEGAPNLPPNPRMPRLIDRVPEGGEELAFISVQGNITTNAGDCELRLMREAQELGADAILVEHAGDFGGGSGSCHGRAYVLKRGDGPSPRPTP